MGNMLNKVKSVSKVVTMLVETGEKLDISKKIYGVEEIADYFIEKIGHSCVENFMAVYMNSDYNPVAVSDLAKGNQTNVVISISEVFRIAILSNAAYLIIAHNHPSGSIIPSNSDIDITKKVGTIGNCLGIHLIDSIIVNNKREYYSIRKKLKEDQID